MFVREYLVDLNASAAAIRAGFSAKSAGTMGAQLLEKKQVAAAIQLAMDCRAASVGVTADFVLRELIRIAGLDIADVFDENGQLRPIKDIPENARRAVSGIETDTRYEGKGEDAELVTTRKLRFWPKDRALELLGKHLKLFTEVVEHKGLEGLAEKIREGRLRVAARR